MRRALTHLVKYIARDRPGSLFLSQLHSIPSKCIGGAESSDSHSSSNPAPTLWAAVRQVYSKRDLVFQGKRGSQRLLCAKKPISTTLILCRGGALLLALDDSSLLLVVPDIICFFSRHLPETFHLLGRTHQVASNGITSPAARPRPLGTEDPLEF
jgi:hypothetical protein